MQQEGTQVAEWAIRKGYLEPDQRASFLKMWEEEGGVPFLTSDQIKEAVKEGLLSGGGYEH